jgi:hypothetical protein
MACYKPSTLTAVTNSSSLSPATACNHQKRRCGHNSVGYGTACDASHFQLIIDSRVYMCATTQLLLEHLN